MAGCLEDSVTAETPKLSIYSYCIAEVFHELGFYCVANAATALSNKSEYEIYEMLVFGSVRSIEPTVSDLWVAPSLQVLYVSHLAWVKDIQNGKTNMLTCV